MGLASRYGLEGGWMETSAGEKTRPSLSRRVDVRKGVHHSCILIMASSFVVGKNIMCSQLTIGRNCTHACQKELQLKRRCPVRAFQTSSTDLRPATLWHTRSTPSKTWLPTDSFETMVNYACSVVLCKLPDCCSCWTTEGTKVRQQL